MVRCQWKLAIKRHLRSPEPLDWKFKIADLVIVLTRFNGHSGHLSWWIRVRWLRRKEAPLRQANPRTQKVCCLKIVQLNRKIDSIRLILSSNKISLAWNSFWTHGRLEHGSEFGIRFYRCRGRRSVDWASKCRGIKLKQISAFLVY